MLLSYIPKELIYFWLGYVLDALFLTGVTSTYVCSGVLERASMCPHPDFDGYVVSSLHVLWSKTDRATAYECAVDCYRDQRCRAFFYNRLTVVCQGHSNSSLSIADAVPEDGWVHYRYCLQTDCTDARQYGRDDGIYTVAPSDGLGDIRVYCDMRTDGGGWLVFQRRTDGSEDFTREWDDYKNGFGFMWNEFWLGNDYIHRLTAQRSNQLRIDLEDFEEGTCVSTYTNFHLTDEDDLYTMTSGAYSGQCGDSLSYSSGHNFSTVDRDNDVNAAINCASYCPSGWWFNSCISSQLNGRYNNTEYAGGICWAQWKGFYYSLKSTEMKIRPSTA